MMNARRIITVVAVLFCLFAAPLVVVAAQDMGGWEEDGAYNQLYQATELDKLKGNVEKVTTLSP